MEITFYKRFAVITRDGRRRSKRMYTLAAACKLQDRARRRGIDCYAREMPGKDWTHGTAQVRVLA